MDAREPGLLEVACESILALPDRRRKRLSALVDSERMIGVLDAGVKGDIVVRVLVLVEVEPESKNF
jgi:hypothetical protein